MIKPRLYRIYYIIGLLIGTAIIAALILYALGQNINLYFVPEEIALGKAPVNKLIRVGGVVKTGTVKRGENLDIEFVITDFSHDIFVKYSGMLPDLFREGQGVVALGKLDKQNKFIAQEILAKHDENYMPPNIGLAGEGA